MPALRTITSYPKLVNLRTQIGMIFSSWWMTIGVASGISGIIAAITNWFIPYSLLPNTAVTLATFGAALVAGRVAWDYNGRGLNAKQAEETEELCKQANLNETQAQAVAELIASSDLTDHQKRDLWPTLQGIHLADIVDAQRYVTQAMDDLANGHTHGNAAVVYREGRQLKYQLVASPMTDCQRQHQQNDTPFDWAGTVKSILETTENGMQWNLPAILWKPPVSKTILAKALHSYPIFSREDCEPKWISPANDDYVLKRDDNGKYAWEQLT